MQLGGGCLFFLQCARSETPSEIKKHIQKNVSVLKKLQKQKLDRKNKRRKEMTTQKSKDFLEKLFNPDSSFIEEKR